MAINKRLISYPTAAGDTPAAAIKPSENFETVLYTGNGGTQSITGGWIGKGAEFNGSSSYIENTSLDLKDYTSITLSAWATWTQGVTGTKPIIGGTGNDGSSGSKGNRQTMHIHQSLNRFDYNTKGGDLVRYTIPAADRDEGWHHFLVTDNGGSDSSTAVKMYLDGNEVSFSQVLNNPGFSSHENLQIGRMRFNDGTIGGYFDGSIDQVRIFDKVLSSSEVTTLYGENSSPVNPDIVSGCIALYEFEDNVKDTANNGKYGKAAHFNGSSSVVTLPSSFSSTYEGATTWSFSAWVYMPSSAASKYIFTKYNSNQELGGIQIYTDSSSKLNFFVADTSDNRRVGNGNTVLSANTWYHIVAIWSSNNISLYVDGDAETISYWASTYTGSTIPTTTTNSTKPNRFGVVTFGSGTTSYSNIKIDQVRMYSSALSSSDVTNLYNESSVPTANLVAHYKFDGNALDETGDYDGTASNVVYGYDGTASNITYSSALGFTPDLVWIKSRSFDKDHALFDSVRGEDKILKTNTTQAEFDGTGTSYLSSFDSNGFTVLNGNTNNRTNANNETYVAWCWKAAGTAVSNTDGDITSSVSANQAAGFSIVSYTGGGGVDTVGHGLSQQPELMFLKNTSRSVTGAAYHTDINKVGYIFNTSSIGAEAFASSRNDFFNNNTPPTSSVFTVRSYDGAGNDTQDYVGNYSGDTYICYLFHSVDGYQKVGSYTGTGANGNFVETGFEPRWIMIKRTDTSGGGWAIFDSARSTTNPRDEVLFAHLDDDEYANNTNKLDFLSNGFSLESSGGNTNTNGGTYIYLAIAADADTTTPVLPKSFDVSLKSGSGTQTMDFRFAPDLVWLKFRNAEANHYIFDSLRSDKMINSNTTNGNSSSGYMEEGDWGTNQITFDNNLFGSSSKNAVAWAWKAGDHDDSLPEINTNGDIESTVSVNDAAGFSIVKYTGTGANATVGHGLSSAPDLVIYKGLGSTGTSDAWAVYNSIDGATKQLYLEKTSGYSTSSSVFNDKEPTSEVLNIGTWNGINKDGVDYIAYCWYSVSGYSKIGYYNQVSGTTTVSTGFKPDFLMTKRTDNTGDWIMFDSLRNDGDKALYANTNDDEEDTSGYTMAFNDDGFVLTIAEGSYDVDYIYMAFKIN